jgi:hypothetical protein
MRRTKEIFMKSQENVTSLVNEYSCLLARSGADSTELVEGLLVREGDWTPAAASHLLQLAKNYGSFMLRNALAISLAFGIEDGELGF